MDNNMSDILLSGFTDEIAPELDTQLMVAGKLGLSHLEIRGVDGRNIAEYNAETEGVALLARLKKQGFQVSSIGSPVGKIGIGDDFEPHFEAYKNVVALAKVLGTRYIRMFSFFIPEGDDPVSHRDTVLYRLEQLLNYAVKEDVILLHENEKDIYGDIAPRCRDLLQHFASPNFRAVFDFANFVQCGQDTAEAYDLLRPYVDYIHIKDALSSTGQVVPAGMGDGQVAVLLDKFKASGYKGFLSLEPHLTDFAGFAALENAEGSGEKKPETDGSYAFAIALNALKSLLWDLNWR